MRLSTVNDDAPLSNEIRATARVVQTPAAGLGGLALILGPALYLVYADYRAFLDTPLGFPPPA